MVVVGRREEVAIRSLEVAPGTLRWSRARPAPDAPLLVQTSAHGTPVAARTVAEGARLELDATVRPVAPGQLAVLYDACDPDLVVGSATVARPVPAFA